MKYKVGDKVRVRQWEDMVREFGMDNEGWIKTKVNFVLSMYKYCGNEYIVKECYHDYCTLLDCGPWNFSYDSLEPVEESTEFVYDHSEEKEMVNHPQHYQGKYECIDMMIVMFGAEAVKHFCMCNSFKYRFRAEQKNGAEDIRKAEWYENMMMELDSGVYMTKMEMRNVKKRDEVLFGKMHEVARDEE